MNGEMFMKKETKAQTASAAVKKLLSIMLALVMLFSITSTIPITAEAASYSSNYKRWSQNKSDYDWMRNWGCSVVAEAKMIYETGIKTSSFNPDVYYKWCKDKGYVNNGGFVYEDNAVRYAKSLGNTKLSYLGNTTKSVNDKIKSNAKNGYYSIVDVGNHYVMVDNTKTKSTGTIYVYDSFGIQHTTNAPEKDSFTLSERGYTAKSVRTFKYDGTSTSTTNITVKFNGNGGTVSASSLSVSKGSTMGSKIPTATRYGYLFDGWYTAASGGTRYTNSTKINSSTTLYAHWSKINDYTGGLKGGRIYKIVNKKSDMALQASGTGDGSLVKQQPKNDSKSQLWKVGFAGGVVFSSVNGGRVFDIKSGSMENAAQLQLYGLDDASKNNRIFVPVSRGSGYYSIHALHSNRVLDVAGASTNAGTQIQQYYYTGNAQQLFSFQEYSRRTVTFYDNLSNNYLPTPREVYNYS